MYESMSQEERQIRYDEIMTRARKAQIAPYRHHCERYQHIAAEWNNGGVPLSSWEVFEKCNEEDDDATVEVVFQGTKAECEAKFEYQLRNMPDSFWLEERGRCKVCDMYEKRRAAVKEGRQPPFLIVCYGISRHYLGAEEGGCWGDATEVLEVGQAYTWRGGLKLAREFREQYPQPRFSRGSCANRGEPDVFIRLVYAEADPRMPKNYFPSGTYQ